MNNLDYIKSLQPWQPRIFVGFKISNGEANELRIDTEKLTKDQWQALSIKCGSIANAAIKKMMR